MQAKDPTKISPMKLSDEESRADEVLDSPTPSPERPATMMEVIGWEMTQALYHAHKLCIQPPTDKQREQKSWSTGQHRQYLIETAKLITTLLVEVSTQAAAQAKEAMNAQINSKGQGTGTPNEGGALQDHQDSIRSGDGTGLRKVDPGPAGDRHSGVEGEEPEVEKSTIIVPEGFGR